MCYKALLLLEFLVKQGPAKVADDVAASMSVLDRLQRFEYKDPNGKDHVRCCCCCCCMILIIMMYSLILVHSLAGS